MLLFLFRTTFTITNSKCIMCVVAQDCLTIVVTIERTKWLQVITKIFLSKENFFTEIFVFLKVIIPFKR